MVLLSRVVALPEVRAITARTLIVSGGIGGGHRIVRCMICRKSLQLFRGVYGTDWCQEG